MPETMSLSAGKARLSELVDRVETQQERIVLTRNGKPAAVLISPDDLEGLEETLEIMSDPQLLAQIRESEESLKRGERWATLDEVKAELEQRLAKE